MSLLCPNGSNTHSNGVSLYTADVANPANATLVASLPGDSSALKASRTASGDVHFLLYSKADLNGTTYSEATVVAPKSIARLYNSIYVRH
jgi:hypothetical protein